MQSEDARRNHLTNHNVHTEFLRLARNPAGMIGSGEGSCTGNGLTTSSDSVLIFPTQESLTTSMAGTGNRVFFISEGSIVEPSACVLQAVPIACCVRQVCSAQEIRNWNLGFQDDSSQCEPPQGGNTGCCKSLRGEQTMLDIPVWAIIR